MNTDEKLALFDELIAAAEILTTQADQAAVVLDERFENVVRGPIYACRAVLDRCPIPGGAPWDGVFREEDCEFEFFKNDRYVQSGVSGEDEDPLVVGVRVTHRPTGLSRESKSKNSRDENRAAVLRSLVPAVENMAAARRQ